MPQRLQNTRRAPEPCRQKNAPCLGYYRLVREMTRGTTYEGHPLDEQVQQINAYLDKKQQTDASEEAEYGTAWSDEWLEQRIEWLDRFCKLFIRHVEPNPLHVLIDQLFPVTHMWDGYLYQANPLRHVNPSSSDPFLWDLYLLIHRPIKCSLCPGWDTGTEPGMAQFTIEIPPPLVTQTDVPDESNGEELATSDQAYDPFECVRKVRVTNKVAWSKKSGKQYNQVIEQHFIDPEKTVKVVNDELIPFALNEIVSKPEDFGIKLQSWSPSGNTPRLEGSYFKLQLQIRDTDETNQSTHGTLSSTRSKATSRLPSGRSITSSLKSSLRKASSQSGSIKHRPANHDRQPTHHVSLYVRFIPVYSMNDLQSKNPFVLRSFRYVDNPRSIFLGHTFLRPSFSRDLGLRDGQWQVCTRLAERAQLGLLDRTDKGQRRAAARLVFYLFHISDSVWKTRLLKWIEPSHLRNIALHVISQETDLSNQKVLAYLSNHCSKTVVWQRSPLTPILLQLLRYVHGALQDLRLPTFNGIVTNLFQTPADDLERKALSKTKSVLGAWVKSEAALRQVLELAIKRMSDSMVKSSVTD